MYLRLRILVPTLYILILTGACIGPARKANPPTEQTFMDTLEIHLTSNLLDKFYPACIDSQRGGYYSVFSYDWQRQAGKEKFLVSQARHLWTCSEAAKIYPDQTKYAYGAAKGYEFIKDHFWDKEQGGFYTLLDMDGNLIMDSGYKDEKRTYANAFGIYALASYYELTSKPEVLRLAQDAFYWLDKHAHDSVHLGYYSFLQRDGKLIEKGYPSDNWDAVQFGMKDQNPTIHLLEAYTALYRVWPDSLLRARTLELLQLVRDVITHNKGYMRLFFNYDWTPVSFRDSSARVRENHYVMDHVSYGHDIETAFLMMEAAETLKAAYDTTLIVARRMVDHTLASGFDREKGGVYERGYYLPGVDSATVLDDRKNWWAQAEGFHTLLMFSKLFPKDSTYLHAARLQWKYIDRYIIDKEHGGWYEYGLDTHPSSKTAHKAHIWKAAYHDGRALMASIKLLNEQ